MTEGPDSTTNQQAVSPAGSPKALLSFLARCWRGQARLWQAFWLVSMLGGVALVALFVLIAKLVAGDGVLEDVLWTCVRVFGVALLVFSLVSVWRCAFNTNYHFAGIAARAYVAFVIAYLLFELVLRLIGGGFLKEG